MFKINSLFPIYHRPSFKLEILTTTSNEDFILPLLSDGTYNFTVEWGDGSKNTITSYDDPNATHVYTTAGTYMISMLGTCTKFSFEDTMYRLKVKRLFDVVDMGFTVLNFYGCFNLTSISSNLKKLTHLVTAMDMFHNCPYLTSIPAGIFDGSTGILNFNSCFCGCSSISSIPIDLFRYNTEVGIGYSGNFNSAFTGCYNLRTVPADLFRYNTHVWQMFGVFMYCTNLETVPEGLFKYNTDVNMFEQLFRDCTKLQFNENIFWGVGERDTRFFNKSPDFQYCFYRDSFSGNQGTAPDLWNCNYGSGGPSINYCFSGVGNSLTSLANYNAIPSNWKNPA